MAKKMNKKIIQNKVNAKTEELKNNPSDQSINQQKKNYPKDIQGLFERLGID